jgi:hypothetical protein
MKAPGWRTQALARRRKKKEERKMWWLASTVSKAQWQGCTNRECLATNQLDALNERTPKAATRLSEMSGNTTCLP